MKTALPFLLLPVVAAGLWFAPAERFVLTFQELTQVMHIEGFVLFFCFMFSGFLGGKLGEPAGEGDPIPWLPIGLLIIVGGGLGGGIAHLAGGRQLAAIYVVSLLLHMTGAIGRKRSALRPEAVTNMVALLALVATGFLAWLVVPPGRGYPRTESLLQLRGQQLLAWVFVYFVLLAWLHASKERIFALVSASQTPR
jgi:hypothetical protein